MASLLFLDIYYLYGECAMKRIPDWVMGSEVTFPQIFYTLQAIHNGINKVPLPAYQET